MNCCVQCGSTENLIELQNGKYGCKKCLNKLGKEQNEIETFIVNYLKNNFDMSVNNQIKTLKAIAINLEFKNGLLNQKELNEIKKTYERMFGNSKGDNMNE